MEQRLENIIETLIRLTPNWLLSMIVLVAAVIIGYFVHRLVFRLLTRLVAERDLFWRSLVSRNRRPLRLAIVVWLLTPAVNIAPLTDDQAGFIRHLLLLAFIILLGWSARTALLIWMTVYLRRFKLDAEDNLLARKHVTQSRILERVAATLIVAVALSAALMTFPAVRQYGVSLMASAGVAGIVLGLALQPVLKNLFAGIQIAITQPIRIDDALIVEGEWGKVEEITSTYVVVKLWDWRRLILPLGYFIEKPFQNWTREGAALIGTVMIYLDYTVPVDDIRRKVEEIATGSKLWDGQVINVAVTDFRENVMEIRILVSAADGGRTFDLRCEVREKLIDYIQRTYPDGLPKVRAQGVETQSVNASVASNGATRVMQS